MINSFGYIYKTTCLRNRKVYIGQKYGAFKSTYLGSGLLISRAVNKYGRDSFKVELLTQAKNSKKLDRLEKKFIADYRKIFGRDKLYNIADGGLGGATRRGKEHPNWGKPLSPDIKRKLRLAWKTRVVTQETKDKMSIAFSGKKNSFYGKHHTPEAIEANRLAHLGKPRKPHPLDCKCCCCYHKSRPVSV